MFNADPKVMAKIAPLISRVAIFDPLPASAKLASELLKQMGARQTVCATRTIKGLELIAHLDPQLILTEYNGPEFDGPDLVRRLRRSSLGPRKAPVIMLTSVATVDSIKAARDSGVHEFLRKPYTAKDLFRRVENVCLNPRVWIDAQMYVGPDRRRFNSGEFVGAKKRNSDAATAADFKAAAEAEIARVAALAATPPQAAVG